MTPPLPRPPIPPLPHLCCVPPATTARTHDASPTCPPSPAANSTTAAPKQPPPHLPLPLPVTPPLPPPPSLPPLPPPPPLLPPPPLPQVLPPLHLRCLRPSRSLGTEGKDSPIHINALLWRPAEQRGQVCRIERGRLSLKMLPKSNASILSHVGHAEGDQLPPPAGSEQAVVANDVVGMVELNKIGEQPLTNLRLRPMPHLG